MALVKCHECGSDVSTEAAACMKCGAKPRAVDTSSVVAVNKGNPVFVFGAIVFCVALIGMAYLANSIAPVSPTTRTTPPGQKLFDEEIERQADLCKNGHNEACDTERQLAQLKRAGGK